MTGTAVEKSFDRKGGTAGATIVLQAGAAVYAAGLKQERNGLGMSETMVFVLVAALSALIAYLLEMCIRDRSGSGCSSPGQHEAAARLLYHD